MHTFENPASKYQGGKITRENLSAEDLESTKKTKNIINKSAIAGAALLVAGTAPSAIEKTTDAIEGKFPDKHIVMTEGQRSEMATASIQQIIEDFKEKAAKVDQAKPEVAAIIDQFEKSEEAFGDALNQEDATLKVNELNKIESEMNAEQLELLRKSL
ncbi:MAG: hypothetical protein ACD_8C00028G0005 [uncultured bacterium]|nr:MAG: hypothetical protein ACD_8C00028G0005 [uncultured bacterium]